MVLPVVCASSPYCTPTRVSEVSKLHMFHGKSGNLQSCRTELCFVGSFPRKGRHGKEHAAKRRGSEAGHVPWSNSRPYDLSGQYEDTHFNAPHVPHWHPRARHAACVHIVGGILMTVDI